jgi:glutamate synthase (NADPH/NADH) small chain
LIALTTDGLKTTKWGTFVHDEETSTTIRGRVFCAGDVVTGTATVVLAMEAGQIAAKAIHRMIIKKDLNQKID